MVKAKDGTDSVESFEMEVAEEEEEESDEDDDDDEVFVKKGRHGSENGSAKKPLIKGDDQNSSICSHFQRIKSHLASQEIKREMGREMELCTPRSGRVSHYQSHLCQRSL